MAVEKLDEKVSGWDVFVPPAKGGRWPWSTGLTSLIGLITLALLVTATSLWAVGHFESRLEKNVRADLSAAGIESDRLVFDWDYRDVSVTGEFDGTTTENQLLTQLRAADDSGIRKIDLSLDEVAEKPRDTNQFGSVDVRVSLEDGQMLLQGTVLTDGQREQLQAAAERAIGADGIRNQLLVSGLQEKTAGSDQRVASLANSIAGLNQALSADASLSSTDFRFNATVADEDQANDLLRLRGTAGDVGLVISGDIVTKKSAPGEIDVSAKKENGRILLSGTVTSEEHKQALVRAAVRAFDSQSMSDEIVVTDSSPVDINAKGIDALVSAISYFDDALEADARLTSSEFEFNALMEFEEDTGPLIAVRDNASRIGLTVAGSVEARQMSLSREVDMLQAEIDSLADEIKENVVFESAKADLGFAAKKTLDKIVDAMNRFQRPVVEIAGHTDDSGPDDANQKLSLFRATAVLEYLKLSGIDGLRLRAIGYGEVNPIASNFTEVGKSQNRRVEFSALGNFDN